VIANNTITNNNSPSNTTDNGAIATQNTSGNGFDISTTSNPDNIAIAFTPTDIGLNNTTKEKDLPETKQLNDLISGSQGTNVAIGDPVGDSLGSKEKDLPQTKQLSDGNPSTLELIDAKGDKVELTQGSDGKYRGTTNFEYNGKTVKSEIEVNYSPTIKSTPSEVDLISTLQRAVGLSGNQVDGIPGPETFKATGQAGLNLITNFAKNNPELINALAINAIAGGTTPKSDLDKFVDSTSNTINNAAGALDQAIKQAAENDNNRNLHSDDPVERAFNGLVAMGTPVWQAIDATGNHVVAIAKAGQELSQDPLGTLGYGLKGTVDSAGDAALDTVVGWVWALQEPGTAWETAKLVGGDIQRDLERQMNEDPSGFAASTVLNIGSLLTPVSAAKIPSFTLTPLKAATTTEKILSTIPALNAATNVPKAVVQGGKAVTSFIPKAVVRAY
jgi:hypothetical protein